MLMVRELNFVCSRVSEYLSVSCSAPTDIGSMAEIVNESRCVGYTRRTNSEHMVFTLQYNTSAVHERRPQV
jgi:hypothetical protein